MVLVKVPFSDSAVFKSLTSSCRFQLVPIMYECSPRILVEGVVAQWCNLQTLKPEQSGGVGSIPGRTPPLECHDKGSQTNATSPSVAKTTFRPVIIKMIKNGQI